MIQSLSGKTVLLTTHRMRELYAIKESKVTFLHKGKNKFTGSIEEFQNYLNEHSGNPVIESLKEELGD